MDKLEEKYIELMSVSSLENFSNEKGMIHINKLMQVSFMLQKSEGVKKVIELSESFQHRELSPKQGVTFHYTFSNAWSDVHRFSNDSKEVVWDWENNYTENELLHLRKALNYFELQEELPDSTKCEILTNIGNVLSKIGRFSEAVEYWDNACEIIPNFGMAIGNKAYGLCHYAQILYDSGHAHVFLQFASKEFSKALESGVEQHAVQGFTQEKKRIEQLLSKDREYDFDMDSHSLGDNSEEEIGYRKWCLTKRLFVNPLNDLGAYSIAATDVLSVPSIVVAIGEGPYYHGYFDQMKQEFVSSRYLFYEGVTSKEPHFSDKDVQLHNTFDYPVYSLSIEKVKHSFRGTYAILDKVAFFLNHYLSLGIKDERVNFKTFWYESGNKKKGLRKEFQLRENWPLRGLYWLSRDLYENKEGFDEVIDPEAREIRVIRNHLEHKYLKICDFLYEDTSTSSSDSTNAINSLILGKITFENKVLRMLKMVRSALIYLSLSVHIEERIKSKNRPEKEIVPPMPLTTIDDEWKQ